MHVLLSVRNLFLAYCATWAIHLGYLIFLVLQSRRLSREERELGAPEARR